VLIFFDYCFLFGFAEGNEISEKAEGEQRNRISA